MSLANPEDFQFSLEEQFKGRLFTRRTDLSNDIRLLIGTNALHAILNRAWKTITHLADVYGVSRTFNYSLANSIKKIGQFLFKEATLTTHASLLREHAILFCHFSFAHANVEIEHMGLSPDITMLTEY